MSLSGFTKALVVAGFSVFSSMASADWIATYNGGTPSPQRLLRRVRPGL